MRARAVGDKNSSYTSSNQRLRECVRSKMDSQSVVKEYASNGAKSRREESHHATFWRTDCVTNQKNICLQNKLEFVLFFSKGFTAKEIVTLQEFLVC